jgi:hypothetical protein
MKLTFKHSLLLAFCAVLIFAVIGIFHRNLDKFTVTLTLFFLLLAKAGISHRFTSTATGILATLLLLLIIGGNFAGLFRMIILPALIIDFLVLVYPTAINSPLRCTLTAGIAVSGPALWALASQLLSGSEPLKAVQNYLATFGVPTLFAMLGGLPVPAITSKVKALLPASGKSSASRKK